MAKMPKEVMELFNDPTASKVLCTVDPQGEINAAPKGTLRAIDEETLAFADIMGKRTRENLEATKKAVAVAFKYQPLSGYRIKGTFLGFQTSGELFEAISKQVKEMLKLDTRAVGLIRVEEVYALLPPKAGERIA